MTEIITAQENPISVPSNKQDINKLAGEGGISLVGKFGGRLLLIAGQIAVARILGPALFGIFSIGTTIFRLVQIFAPLGLPNGVIWFGSKYYEEDIPRLRGVILQNILLASFSGTAITAIFYLSALKIANFYKLPELTYVIRWFSISLGVITLLRVTAAATRISQTLKYSVIFEDLLQPFLFLASVIIFHGFAVDLLGALLANFISFAVPVLLCGYYVYRLFFYSKDKSFILSVSTKALLIYSLPTAFLGIVGTANNWMDRLIIGFFRSAQEIGFYNAASQISMIFIIILIGIASIISPMIATLHHQGEIKRVSEIYRVSTKWGFYLGIPIFVVICFFPQDLMLIFGKEYSGSAIILVLLSIGQIISLSIGNVGYLLVMTGEQNAWLIISVISLFLNIVINIIFTIWLGVIGTAISTTLAVVFMSGLGLLYARHRSNIWPFDRRFMKGVGASSTVIVAAVALKFFGESIQRL